MAHRVDRDVDDVGDVDILDVVVVGIVVGVVGYVVGYVIIGRCG